MPIRIQHFLSMRIRIQIQGFDDQKYEKIYSRNRFYLYFYDQKFIIPRPP